MARRVDWDDDDFEILNELSPIKLQENFEFIEDDSFEIVPCKNKPPSLINTNPIPHVPIIEKSVPSPIKIDKPIVNEVKQSFENSSPSLVNSTYLPIRYGSAAIIPHEEGFNLKSILTRKPNQPNQTNDLMNFLQSEKSKTQSFANNNLQQLLIDNDHDRQTLIQIAKQAQQDFINAIYFD